MNASVERKELGRRGEQLAADFFTRRGYTIVARNWSCRWGELDLVVHRGADLRVIEVKTRRRAGPVGAFEAVTGVKLHRIGEALARFLAERPSLPDSAHIDVLEVTFTPAGVPVYRWLKDFS